MDHTPEYCSTTGFDGSLSVETKLEVVCASSALGRPGLDWRLKERMGAKGNPNLVTGS